MSITDPIWRSVHWSRVPLWLWSLLGISFCVNMYFGILWIKWNAAISPQEALKQYPDLAAQIEPNWKAVLISHGTVSEWPRGTSQQDPEGYRSATYYSDFSGLITTGLAFAVLLKAPPKKRPED